MKRLMMLVAMMAFVLLLPMNAKAADDLVIDQSSTYKLTANTTVNNLYVYSYLDLNGYKLEVLGDVVAEHSIDVGTGILTVAGDYIQKERVLTVGKGSMTVKGDFRIQTTNANGEYVSSSSVFDVRQGGTLTLEGNAYIDSVYYDYFNLEGTIIAKGDFIIENTQNDINIANLTMAGSTTQTLKLVENVYVKDLVLTNPNVKIGGCLNATLGSNADKITLDDGKFESSNLKLNGYKMVIPGNAEMTGNVQIGTGILEVTGSYIQKERVLTVGKGSMTVKGDFRIQTTNADGEYVSSNSVFDVNQGGTLTLEGNTYINSSYYDYFNLDGTVIVKGDFIIENTQNDINIANLTMAGSKTQKLQLIEKVYVKDLVLTNPNVKVGGFLNATLGSNADKITLDDGTFQSSNLNLNGYKMVIPGNAEMTGNIKTGTGILEVTGNYIQKERVLTVGKGSMTVKGDFRVQTTNADGEYVSSSSVFDVNQGGSLTVEGNTYINSSYSDYFNLDGTITAKGDFIVDKTQYAVNMANLTLAGNKAQTLQLVENVSVKDLVLTNPNVKVVGYFNVTLGSNADKITLDDGILQTTGLKLNGYKMVVPGTVHADGNVAVGDGALTVNEDYVQMDGLLSVATGTIDIKGNLRIQSMDANGGYITGTGIFESKEGSIISVGKSLYINTSNSMSGYIYGTLTVAGDIKQTSTVSFCPKHVILNGTEKQTVSLAGSTSVIRTLELTQETKRYTFNPNPCWDNLIQLEGIENTADGFKYYEDGAWATKEYKYVEFDKGLFLVANGYVATHIEGLAQDPENPNDWYYLAAGQAQTQYTGLAFYDGKYFYVAEGKLDTTLIGFVKYDTGLFYVGLGRLMNEVSGLAQDPETGNWYYLAGGQVQDHYTGLATYNGEWFYVIEGKLAEDYTGKVEYDGTKFNVVNGMVKF